MKRLYRLLACLTALSWPALVVGAEADVGIVLMHGKWDRPPTHVAMLARTLESKGYKVSTPVMSWSGSREYDADYERTLSEIDAAAQSLREKGAKRIIVGGQSFGANAAIAYAGAGKEIDGVMALAPGHTPDLPNFRNRLSSSVEKARQLVGEGKGDSKTSFEDLNQGKTRSVQTTPNVYLSFFDPDGLASMPKSAASIPRPVPFLWVIGTQDGLLARGENYVFNKAPQHPNNKYLIVTANHADTPSVAAEQIVEWLASLGY